MKDVFIIIVTVLTFILAFAGCVDAAAKPSLKQAFNAYLNRRVTKRGERPTGEAYELAVRSFEAVLGARFLSFRFFFNSLLASVAFILIYSLFKSRLDAQYLGLVRSVLFSPSSIVDCVAIVLIGTLLSDWLCFGKSLFFVQLFSLRRRFFPILLLATADLCLTILIFTVVVGLSVATATIEFDRTANKHVSMVATAIPSSGLGGVELAPTDPSDRNSNEAAEFVARFNPNLVNIIWEYKPTWEQFEWVKYLSGIPKEQRSAPAGLLTSLFVSQHSVGEKKQSSMEDYIIDQFALCPPQTLTISGETLGKGEAKFEVEEAKSKEHAVIHTTINMMTAKIDVDIDQLIWPNLSLQKYLSLWADASQLLLSEYATVIQNVGLKSWNGFSLLPMYVGAMQDCKWKLGAANALKELFLPTSFYGKDVERFSLPLAALPYAGLAATMFFHGIALFGFLGGLVLPVGNLLLSEGKSFNTGQFPFTIVAMTGSLLTLSLFLAVWLLLSVAF